ncbi:hypothetical protein N8T08_000166 [Aspergillus melleus]|uniref:Uncharacterized protein n=1 Tax=Aspergillus melleus TaxID=138277 RepID=A0ACC3BHH6_9EURO|nr:hypothetical protein N8T08_000166 [Aspergillus melleus]
MVVTSDTHARDEMKASGTTTATSIGKDELRLLANLAFKIRHIVQGVGDQYVRQVMQHIKQSQDRQDASFYFPETFVTNTRLLNLHRWEFGSDLGKVVKLCSPRNEGPRALFDTAAMSREC